MFMGNIYKTASLLCCLCVFNVSSSHSEEFVKQSVQIKEEGLSSAKGKPSRIKPRLKREKNLEPLSLEDFAGSFVVVHESMGGVDGGVGFSRAGVGVRTFDKKGNSTFSSTHLLNYNGTPGEVSSYDTQDTNIKITITDPVKGLGTLQIITPNRTINTNIVVQRSARDGAVIAFYTPSPAVSSISREQEGVLLVSYLRQVQ